MGGMLTGTSMEACFCTGSPDPMATVTAICTVITYRAGATWLVSSPKDGRNRNATASGSGTPGADGGVRVNSVGCGSP